MCRSGAQFHRAVAHVLSSRYGASEPVPGSVFATSTRFARSRRDEDPYYLQAMTGDPVSRMLNPAQLAEFRAVTGVDAPTLAVDFTGWSKLAVLTEDRVFLFPRREREVGLLRGARVCDALAQAGVTVAPAVRGWWIDPEFSFAPCVEFERRGGPLWSSRENNASIDQVEQMLQSLGAAIATWHRRDLPTLPREVQVPATFESKSTLDRFLSPADMEVAVHEVAQLADAPRSWTERWIGALDPMARLSPVLIHGDVCEGQLLVDADLRVATVLDRDTAGIGHPLHDFDFGEWGFGIFEWEVDFARLRQAMWDAYAARVNTDWLPSAAQVHLAFTLSEFLYFGRRHRERSLDDWGKTRLERIGQALGPATEAVN
jgi:aminoglycoside phosphotransferase (APT) family kinase protein